jgi:hypothetical protein
MAHAEIKGGKYTLSSSDGPNLGRYKVVINWSKKTGRQVDVSGDVGNKTEGTREAIPTRYNKNATEVVEIKSGTNTFNFDLKSSPR